MPMTREEIEAKRAEAMAKGGARAETVPGETVGAPRVGGGAVPNQSRMTLARAAIRPEMKGRVMLSGPAGAGKTYTALVIATILVGTHGRILVIDSEKESSLTYADEFQFEQLPWNPPFDPTALSLTLKEAAETYDACIVDSFSHFWRKQGGVLDIAGDFRGWKTARPIQENLIETILDVDMHVIVCCRSKMDHVMDDSGGKTTITKVGMKPQQDDDLEYEVNVALEVDMPHVLHVVKSRTNAVPVGSTFLAGLAGDFAQTYRDWLKSGESVAEKVATDLLREGLDQIADIGERTKAKNAFLDRFGRPEFLLVSRLGEAQQWVVDVVTGRLPVERAEDDVPPDPSGSSEATGSSISDAPAPGADSSATTSPGAQERPPAEGGSDPAGKSDSSDPPGAPAAESIDHRPDVDGPQVFNGDTGHCDDCGGPTWYAADEADGGPGWLHAEESDAETCPGGGPVRPAPEGTDVDALYAATHDPAAELGARRAVIEAEVAAMKPTQVIVEMKKAGVAMTGTPKANKERWLEHRLRTELGASTSVG